MRRTARQRFCQWWLSAPCVVRDGVVITAVILVILLLPGCALQHIRPYADPILKNENQRIADPRWGPIYAVEIGIKAEF